MKKPLRRAGKGTRKKLPRLLIVYDGKAWFVRRVASITHDLDNDQKIYCCDAPIGGRCSSLAEAVITVTSLKRFGKVP